MNADAEIIAQCGCPSRCFCKFNPAELVDIAYKKLSQRIPTVDLMNNAKSRREKELLCVVCMLDIDDHVAEIMIREHMADATCDVMSCRDGLKKRLLKVLETRQEDR